MLNKNDLTKIYSYFLNVCDFLFCVITNEQLNQVVNKTIHL